MGLILLLALCALRGDAAVVVYSQPHTGSGGFYQSSSWDPDGSDYDQLTWDSFSLSNSVAVTEVRWRGQFDPSYFGSGGLVIDFTVAIHGDIANGFQPGVTHPPLVEYQTGGNAGVFGGVTMYDYHFVLQLAVNSFFRLRTPVMGLLLWMGIPA